MLHAKHITSTLLAFATMCCAQSTQPITQFKIGYDTTRINGPLLPDGTIDYTTALRQTLSAGVTPENNAFPLIQQAGTQWKRYPTGIDDDLKRDQLDKEWNQARQKPWNPADYPDVTQWLANNEAALKMVVEASERPRLCPPPQAPGEVPRLMVKLGDMREFTNALTTRALLRISQGDLEGAHSDIAAQNRLASLLTSLPDGITALLAMAMDTDVPQLAAARASPANARRWLTERLTTPFVHLSPAQIDIQNRYTELTLVMMMLRGDSRKVIEQLTFLNVESMFTGKANRPLPQMPGDLQNVDWNLVLKHINAVNDDLTEIIKEPDLQKRTTRFNAYSDKLDAEPTPGNLFSDVLIGPLLKPQSEEKPSVEDRVKIEHDRYIKQVEDFLKQGHDESRDAYSLRIAQFFTHEAAYGKSFVRLAGIGEARHNLYTIAIALEIYKADHGNYPDSLAPLTPQYLKTLPLDLYSGKEPIYRITDKTYLLYSIGPNGRDDGGERRGEKDDIAVK